MRLKDGMPSKGFVGGGCACYSLTPSLLLPNIFGKTASPLEALVPLGRWMRHLALFYMVAREGQPADNRIR